MPAPEKATEIKGAVAAVFAFLTALWGWLGWTILVWIACMFLDYISGTAAAKRLGEWDSAVARDGAWHKAGEVLAVLLAALCDIALQLLIANAGVDVGIQIGPLVTPIVLLWYIITELGSIAENAGKLGAPIPAWLKKSLKQYKSAIDASQGENDPPAYVGKHENQSEIASEIAENSAQFETIHKNE